MDDPKELYEQRDQVQIVDVREPYEWEAGHIEEAIHIPAALMLQARGYDAHNLEGGTERWVTAGLPVVTADGSPGQVA